jgi:5-aminolevulinate synthase
MAFVPRWAVDRQREARLSVVDKWTRRNDPKRNPTAYFTFRAKRKISGFIFTSALPPAIAAGAIAGVQYLKHDASLRALHQKRVSTLKQKLSRAGLPIIPSPSHIVPVLVGNAATCKAVSDELLNCYSIYAQPINYPTVPRGTERLRLTPTPLHSDCDIERLVSVLREVWDRLELMGAA